MAGGDPGNFRKTPVGVTPFIIIYTADENGMLKFAEYRATGKAENMPSIRKCMLLFDSYFRCHVFVGRTNTAGPQFLRRPNISLSVFRFPRCPFATYARHP